MPVAIVGMHRSGTSLLAQMLHRSGLYLGPQDRLLGPAFDNPTGFWEHVGFSRLNEAVLAELGGGWDAPPRVPARWAEEPRLGPHAADARELLDDFSAREPWGWKDPRTSLTLSLWRDLIPDLKVVLCLRNPLEVASSLRRRNGFSYSKAIRLWQLYNDRALDMPAVERIVVSYDRVLSAAETELARVLEFLGIPTTPGVLHDAVAVGRNDLRHIRFGTEDLHSVHCHPRIVELYARLGAEAGIAGQDVVRVSRQDGSELIVDELAVEAMVAARWTPEAPEHDRPTSLRGPERARAPGYTRGERCISGGSELVTGGDVQVEVGVLDGLRSSLRQHLAESLRVVLDEDSDDRDLLAEGLLDSMAIMELVAFIEETFDTIVEDDEIIADNFRSLHSMVSYVTYKKTGLELVDPYVASVREFVAQATPPGAFVLVLNSGDGRLLQVPDRVVWPFPCDDRGTFGATGNPADGQDAIAVVEKMRELGATHIVFLDPQLWWLEYYEGLKTHLGRDGGSVARSPVGVAYALAPPVR